MPPADFFSSLLGEGGTVCHCEISPQRCEFIVVTGIIFALLRWFRELVWIGRAYSACDDREELD
jgi:hypothetical protein